MHGGSARTPGCDKADCLPYVNYPLGTPKLDQETIEAFALNYELVEPMMREVAALSFAGKVWGAAEPTETHMQHLVLGAGNSARWQVEISYGREMFGDADPKGNTRPCGGVLVAELEPDEFLVTGYHVRVQFEPAQQTRRGTTHVWYLRVVQRNLPTCGPQIEISATTL